MVLDENNKAKVNLLLELFSKKLLQKDLISRKLELVRKFQIISVKVYPKMCSYFIIFDFIFSNKVLFEKGEVAFSKSRNVEFLINSDVGLKKLLSLVSREIVDRNSGGKFEHQATCDFKKLIGVKGSHIKSVITAGKIEDRRGIDLWIETYCGILVPIQIKSRIENQNTHKRKYPKIPSIVYDKKLLKDGLLLKFFLVIYTSYKRGIPENLNRKNLNHRL